MRLYTSGWALGIVAGASFALAASTALAQQAEPAPGEAQPQAQLGAPEFAEPETLPGAQPAEPFQPGVGPEFAQIIPPICFDAAGEFSVQLNAAVCGVFEGAPGTEGGVGPTGTIPRTDAAPAVAMQPAPGVAMEPAPPMAEPDEEVFLPEGGQAPPATGY